MNSAIWSDNDGMQSAGCGRNYAVTTSRPPLPDRTGLRQPARLRGGGRDRVHGSAVHVRFQDTPSWLTPWGVAKKRKALERLGLPDFKGRRFITLSLDPKMFGDCPLTGYLEGKEKLRRFLEAGRVAGLWERDAWWAWKLEFQANGWAHWHLIVDRVRKFTVPELFKIAEIWSLGRCNCRRISKSRFGYQFKYAFKGVYQDGDRDSGLCVPQWFLDYAGTKTVLVRWTDENGNDCKSWEEKPETFSRARFWQTSKGFYTGKGRKAPSVKKPDSSIVPRPVRDALHDGERTAVVVARDEFARFVCSARLRLNCDFQQFIRVHLWDAENGFGCTLSARSYCLDPQTINKLLEERDKWKLQTILRENRMTLRLAQSLRLQRKAMERC